MARGLTDREKSIVQLIVMQGSGNKQIAHALGIAEKTVKNYITKIFNRYDVCSRGAIARVAFERGDLPCVCAASKAKADV